ncbi:hypothetical protein NEMIN01_2373 [Nematocida minor]|uniref:uncharacterized protein n=1 Tax=Nematocida minor TaxID=1912983 RepID=UPI00221F863F|nr:uncharacterized protein NEMIN01_2373 [Nematocida minor]KAI5193029.1 hypothetical protein NEMIN01_2373 [Nematocida minor]
MLITVERHEDFEGMLLIRGLSKGSSTYIGTIRLYTIGNKTAITYTSDVLGSNHVFIYHKKEAEYGQKSAEILHMQLDSQILDPILKESNVPKEYKVRASALMNGEIEVKLMHIESGDIKVLSAVEGLDHAVDIFEDIPVEVKPSTALSSEETLVHLFMDTLLT